MKTSPLVSLLRCPYCWGALEVQTTIGHMFALDCYGVLRCDCTTFPMLNGIPILIRDYWSRRLTSLVLARKFEMATSERLSCDVRNGRARRLGQKILRKLRVSNRLGSRFMNMPSYRSALKVGFHGAPVYGEYMRCRFGDLTFLAAEWLINHMPVKKGWILDAPAGAGHLSWALSRRHPGAGIVAMDVSFLNLLSMKRFLLPNALCVCGDANLPLPFRAARFDGILCSDGLHYIDAQALFVSELRRIASHDANILLLHIHNKNAANPTAGNPLGLSQLQKMAAKIYHDTQWQIWDESAVAHQAVSDTESDGGKLEADADARAFDMWIHRPPSLARGCASPPNERLRGKWIVNPMYRRAGDGVYSLRFDNAAYEREFGDIRRFLPEQIKPLFRNGKVQPTRQLVEKRAVLFVPEGF